MAFTDEFERFVSTTILEQEVWPSYVLDPRGVIAYVTTGWDRVASTAGGPSAHAVVGTRWLDHISGTEVRETYATILGELLARRSRRSVTYLYDCNTPLRWRRFAGTFVPLVERRATEASWVVVISTLLEDAPIAARYDVAAPDDARHVASTGLIVQCAGCRRARVVSAPKTWEYVPAYVESPPDNVSHGLCELCREVYYGSASVQTRER